MSLCKELKKPCACLVPCKRCKCIIETDKYGNVIHKPIERGKLYEP